MTSDTLPPYKVSEFADLNLAQRISMVAGVSRVQVFGEQKYAVRVEVDPNQLAAHNIGIDEVQKAIAAQQYQLADRAAGWRQAGIYDRVERRLGACAAIPADRGGVSQRLSRAAGSIGQRARRRGER